MICFNTIKNEYPELGGNYKVIHHTTFINNLIKDNKYEILVQLPASLKTSYNKELPAKAILKGSAKIITKDKRLLERFFEKIIVAIQR